MKIIKDWLGESAQALYVNRIKRFAKSLSVRKAKKIIERMLVMDLLVENFTRAKIIIDWSPFLWKMA